MSVLLQFLTEQGLMLLAGGTVLLAVGALCTAIQDSPVKQQRATEMTVLATLCWLALACVPMPRLSSAFFPLTQPTPAETPDADNQRPLNTQPRVLTKPRPDRADDRPKLQFESPVAGTGAAELLDGPSKPASSRPASDFVLNVEPPDAESVAGIDSTRSPQLSQPPLAGSSPARLAMDPSPDIKPGYDPAAVIAALYVTGAIACGLWLVLGHLLLLGMTQTARRAEGWLAELYADLPYEHVKPRLLVSSRCRRAFSTGVFRPQIVLPADLCQSHRKEQLRDVLLHELAHVVRRDAVDRWLFNLAFPLLYFHPLYWWLRNTAEMSAELIADDMAARSSSPESYAEQLIALAREHGRSLVPNMGALQILGSHTRFYRRMNMLIRRREQLDTHCARSWRLGSLTLFAMVVACGAVLLGIEPLHGQEEDSDAPHAADEAPGQESRAEKPTRATPKAPEGSNNPHEAIKKRDDQNPDQALKQLDAFVKDTAARIDAAKRQVWIEKARASRHSLMKKVEHARQELEKQSEELSRQLDAKEFDEAADRLAEAKRALESLQHDYKVLVDWTAIIERRDGAVQPAEMDQPASPVGLPGAPWVSQPVDKPSRTVMPTRPSAVAGRVNSHKSDGPYTTGIGIDLIQLANAFSDGLEQREIAAIELEHTGRLDDEGPLYEKTLRLAKVRLSSAERKLQVIRKIVESAMRAAAIDLDASKQELQRARSLAEKGVLPKSQLMSHQRETAQAEVRLEILRTILSR